MGYIYVIITSIMWSINSILSNLFSSKLTPLEMTFGRWFIASLIFLPFILFELKKKLPTIKKHWKLICFLSILGMIIPNIILYTASHFTSAVDISLLNRLSPLFIVLISAIFLKIKITYKQILGLALSFIGVSYIIFGASIKTGLHSINSGDSIMLISGISFAIYSILQKKRPAQLSPVSWMGLLATSASVFLAPFFIYKQIYNPNPNKISLEDVSVLLYMGIGVSVIGFLCWNLAINKLGAIKAGILSYLTPVLTAIIAYYALSTELQTTQIVGGIIVFAGVIITSIPSKKNVEIFSKQQS